MLSASFFYLLFSHLNMAADLHLFVFVGSKSFSLWVSVNDYLRCTKLLSWYMPIILKLKRSKTSKGGELKRTESCLVYFFIFIYIYYYYYRNFTLT